LDISRKQGVSENCWRHMDATQVPGQQQRPRISSRSTEGKPPERFDPGPAPDPICAQASSKRSDKSVIVAPASHSPASSKSSLKSTKKTPHGISPHLAVSTTTGSRQNQFNSLEKLGVWSAILLFGLGFARNVLKEAHRYEYPLYN
jgi:hypothetical protein